MFFTLKRFDSGLKKTKPFNIRSPVFNFKSISGQLKGHGPQFDLKSYFNKAEINSYRRLLRHCYPNLKIFKFAESHTQKNER